VAVGLTKGWRCGKFEHGIPERVPIGEGIEAKRIGNIGSLTCFMEKETCIGAVLNKRKT
jgi:hypothetical protein